MRDEASSSLVMRVRRTEDGWIRDDDDDEEDSVLPPLKLRKTSSTDWSVCVFKVYKIYLDCYGLFFLTEI